ncbi:hypothetical protein [Staphylococcus pseudintermedius]|nr:hypothetical protein [Staphylococcus pseudintermedius]
MKEQWLKLSLQFFNDAGTEENTETDNTVEIVIRLRKRMIRNS